MNAHRPKPAIISLSHEQAVDAIAELTCSQDESTDDCQIVIGNHPVYGNCYIIVPPSGNSRVLPCVIQNFDV